MTVLDSTLLYPLWILGIVLGHSFLPAGFRIRFIIVSGLAFLLYAAPFSAVCLGLITLMTYWAAQQRDDHLKRLVAVLSLLIFAFLVYKYQQIYPFFGIPRLVIIVGFSYYVLRALHYLLESGKDTLKPHGFEDFVAYMFFVPTLLVGPIHRFPAFLEDIKKNSRTAGDIQEGLERIIFGYAKVVIVANQLVSTDLAVLAKGLEADHAALAAYMGCLIYGLDLYFQFAGYSDIAVGFSLMMGFRIMENFNWPYIRHNISEFWRCWHISLTSWCRQYVYMGGVALTRNHGFAVIASMVVVGLWHELSFKNIIWGGMHGAAILVCNNFQSWKKPIPAGAPAILHKAAKLVSIVLTFNFVILSFALTKEKSLADTWEVYRTIAGGIL